MRVVFFQSDKPREQLLAHAGLAQQQHGAGGLGHAPRQALDFQRRRAGADEAGDRVLGAPLRRELGAGVFELALQPAELADQRLHGRLGVIHQHQPQTRSL